MKVRIDELEAIVRSRICAVCTDRTVEGMCGLESTTCSLFQLFPLVAQAILATDSDEIGPYVAAIRENVCSVCIDQALDGTCPRRDQVRCALDAYMVPIVEAIEEATGKHLSHEGFKAPQASS
jgi:hypothetical protein